MAQMPTLAPALILLVTLSLHAFSAAKAEAVAAEPAAAPVHLQAAATPAAVSAADRQVLKRAFATAVDGEITRARQMLRQIKNTPQRDVAISIAEWLWLKESGSGAEFESIARFIERHGEWPARDTLYRRADEVIDHRVPPAQVLAWYAKRKPRTGNGFMRLGEAQFATGKQAEAIATLRSGWVDGNFTEADEKIFYQNHREHLSAADHVARTDRLLWERQIPAAKRMLARLQGGERQLAEARLALITQTGNVDLEIAQVPGDLVRHQGLLYDRVRWRRDKGLDDQVDELLAAAPEGSDRAERWWRERNIQARTALGEGRAEEAYALVANHGTIDARSLSEAEWLAGWIALRFLKDPGAAKSHFLKFYETVRYPVSLARGAYWLARTEAEAGGAEAEINRWYGIAAAHSTTYYGQLALLALNRRGPLALPAEPAVSPQQFDAFERSDLVKAARLLAAAQQDDSFRMFITRLGDRAKSPAERFLTVKLAADAGRIDHSVAAAKKAAQEGVMVVRHAFPIPVELNKPGLNPEPALALAVTRQESEFDQQAVSSAGAMGLMQLMPATAKKVASTLRLPFKRKRLTEDAAYNATLGRHYLGQLLGEWDGNYVLTLAAYNAGTSRARQWMDAWGDPRDPGTDVVDWIESIPFSETRNYVQRVLESVQVYRQLLTPQASNFLRLDDDLTPNRGT